MMHAQIKSNQTNHVLAIDGGTPIRTQPMPVRFAMGSAEKSSFDEVCEWYRQHDLDPGYQGHFEELYCQTFSDYHGGGYADAVATGTIALFVALAALDLPKGSHVLVSPITDPGTLSAIILNGLKPKLIDTMHSSYNIGPEQVEQRLDDNVSCIVVVHAAGQAADIEGIKQICQPKGVVILEDCSQAHGASWNGRPVGTYGDIAAFSTMYRKASISGPTGGIVYTQNKELYQLTLAHADRGKPRWVEDFDDRDPNQFLFPALNLHSNEFACAIGLKSLKRLNETIQKRLSFIKRLHAQLINTSSVCQPYHYTDNDSPFFYPIFIDSRLIRCDKITFAKAIRAEGIPLNPHYKYLAANWAWLQQHLVDDFTCPNAQRTIENSFCLYVNEQYGEKEVEDIISAIDKVESYYSI